MRGFIMPNGDFAETEGEGHVHVAYPAERELF